MQDKTRILVVEDDPAVQALLATCLRAAGYWVAAASTAREARDELAHGEIALVLLDLQLPDGDGLTLARTLRTTQNIGIIIVSSAGRPEQRAQGLEVGADDYVAKPVFPRELVARVRNVLDRRRAQPQDAGLRLPPDLRFGPWVLDKAARSLTGEQGETPRLTPAEFSLLLLFAERPRRILSRETLCHLLGTEHPDTDLRSIDTLVSRIRRKLGGDGRQSVIETCRGEGYRFTAGS
ncbi:MAG TPA: response regulator transcription factor [Patescibacteria group bacterium]|nr:response regulator transcription factor [Patescibacteria group bacterium]